MQLILLSGGSGKRLWPLSNNIRSKQFLSLFKRWKNGIHVAKGCSASYGRTFN